ncbi:type VI secretion system protein TssA [Diaphorobacter aerolatus]|uniref:type VI secretion system protein TssA n=1 Tax=Diaphorobacter aerolatus TaxID=1288495 RepID=UPI001D00D2B6|nr:hypothetical protein [Diaphorobacter aerolatus]
MRATSSELSRLRRSIGEHTGRAEAVDFSRLETIGKLLSDIAAEAPAQPGDASSSAIDGSGAALAASTNASAGHAPTVSGPIQTRQQAMQLLDQVIQFLERTEPGNPAPLLIDRAKRLIGVSFLEIINNLAPDAMSTIANVTGARVDTESSQ